jgi:hypothetical protein
LALLARIFVVIFAFLVASLAAAVVMTLGFLLPVWNDLAASAASQGSIGIVIGLAAGFISLYSLFPVMLVLALAEGFRWRSALFYAVVGGALSVLSVFGIAAVSQAEAIDATGTRELQVIAAAGIAAGLAYWALAGRNAGRWRDGRRQGG